MAGFESYNQGMADLEINNQETMEGADGSIYEFAMFSCKSIAKGPEGYAKASKHLNMNNGRRSLDDVVRENVLQFLPAKSLCRFRTVSRRWDQWITNPFFAHRQTIYFQNTSGLFCQVPGLNPSFISFNQNAYGLPDPSLKFLPEPINIRSSSNGLLCCQSVGDNVYYICNPVTKEWRLLPRPTLYHGPEAAIVLVFEPQPLHFNESYELVCAVTFPDHPIVYFEIYSSRSSSWRLSDCICCELDGLKLHNGGYYMKGIVYWESSSGVILAFDLKDEQYGILPLPDSHGQYGALTTVHGELCYILPCCQDDHCNVYIHGNTDMRLKCIIKLTCGDVESRFGACMALPSINDDTLMLALGRKVIAYHVRDQKVELICTSTGFTSARFIPYVNSLVPVVGERA